MDERVLFSVNEYDSDGDISERGVYLHFGLTRIKVAQDIEGFKVFITKLHEMVKEMEGQI